MGYEIRISGEGGQGVVLAGIILAEAAIADGKHVAQTQAYGPESRGGATKSEVIISDREIEYPKATRLDLLLTLTQEACDKHIEDLKDGGLLLVEASRVATVPERGHLVYRLPFVATARDTAGKALAANVVALGALVALSEVVSPEALERAILARAPKRTEEQNLRALAAGFELGGRVKGPLA
ncbi:MAG: 2-oxoacid:acceptor oxidoreductase family protein [candidate division NC10 bacterium]|nr:2-oxoacid:acceptor oxidoreductase family protein [candidate division NC10 bacterium]